MKLIVNKLGRIDHAEIDVRNLTVFVGPNGTNKTWAAYALYGLARGLSNRGISAETARNSCDPIMADKWTETTNQLVSRLTDPSIPLIRDEVRRADIVGSIDKPLEFGLDAGSLVDLLRVDRAAVDGSAAKLILEPSEFKRSIYDLIKITVNHAESRVDATFEKDGTPLLLERWNLKRSNELSQEAGFGESLDSIVHKLLGRLLFYVFDQAAPFPAERKAILSIEAGVSPWAHLQAPLRYYFVSPVSDYVNMIAEAKSAAENDRGESEFKAIAELLENQILLGRTEFDKNRAVNHPLKYRFENGRELGMHAASSMVRSLAGLDLYLKTIAKRGSIIVIDEPEMNAHPEAQLKIIEFLAILANSGIRVVFTTHSPYIVDHLSNLMMASRVAEGSRQTVADRFKLGRPEAFIAPENVSAYLFRENGDVENILDLGEACIDLRTFGEQTEFMVNLIHAILDATPDESQPIEEIRHAV